MERVICLAMGYVFGLFQTGYLYSKSHGIDIRNYGSGNAGSTNILRVMGVKPGAIVFIGDASKMILACLLTRMLFRSQTDVLYLYLLYTGFGVILGHNYPFYMGFKGGKGIAASAGLLASVDIPVGLACLAVFVLIVYSTRYVSLGSILVMIVMFIGFTLRCLLGNGYGLDPAYRIEFVIMTALISGMGIWRHHSNIKRLLSGTENKIGVKK
ncbi:MAG: glycerol-3-phosphate 1-O-acyltransferase PlsY [Brotaphodocola sp.]